MPTLDQALIANPMFFASVSATIFLNWKCFENVRRYIQVDWPYWNQLQLSHGICWVVEHKNSKQINLTINIHERMAWSAISGCGHKAGDTFPWVRKTVKS